VCVVLEGILGAAYYNIAIMMALECATIKLRAYYVCIIFGSIPVGRYLVTPMIYRLHDWKTIVLITALAIMVIVMLLSFFEESPRYYLSRYNYKDAAYVAQKMLKTPSLQFNG